MEQMDADGLAELLARAERRILDDRRDAVDQQAALRLDDFEQDLPAVLEIVVDALALDADRARNVVQRRVGVAEPVETLGRPLEDLGAAPAGPAGPARPVRRPGPFRPLCLS